MKLPYYNYLFLLILLVVVWVPVQAQSLGRQVVSSAGEPLKTADLLLSYNIGEPIVGIYSGDGALLTAGFLQPEISGEPLRPGFNIVQEVVVYPNPVSTGSVKINFKNISSGDYTLDLVDAIGRVMYTQSISYSQGNSVVSLNMTPYAGGTYFIRVRGKNFLQGQGKLIKL